MFDASDAEPEARGERLELLAVVRGLEALGQPSRVTLVTSSRYVRRGMTYGLQEWRKCDWSWEWYGQMVPVKHRDLWKRLDGALQFHHVECRRWRLDASHETLERPETQPPTALVGQLACQPDDTQGPSHKEVAVSRPRSRAIRRPASLDRMPVPQSGSSGSNSLHAWVERAGHFLIRWAGQRTPPGSGRTAICAAE